MDPICIREVNNAITLCGRSPSAVGTVSLQHFQTQGAHVNSLRMCSVCVEVMELTPVVVKEADNVE
jgi:hypothetical protein